MHALLGKFCSINIKKGRYREWCIISSSQQSYSQQYPKADSGNIGGWEEQGQKSVSISEHRNVVLDTDATWICEKWEGIVLARQAFSWSCSEQAVVGNDVLWRAEGAKERKQSMFWWIFEAFTVLSPCDITLGAAAHNLTACCRALRLHCLSLALWPQGSTQLKCWNREPTLILLTHQEGCAGSYQSISVSSFSCCTTPTADEWMIEWMNAVVMQCI